MLMTMILMVSTLMAISSSNWFFIWLSMELNMLSFIPIMLNNNTMMEMEGSIKYFLTQSVASSCMLMSSMMMWSMMFNYKNFNLLLMFIIFMKLGTFPCHFWFPHVMSSCKWYMCILLTTWQKLIPIFLFIFIININNTIILVSCILNMFIGGLFGMSSNNLKSIMAYSSIAHMGWMMTMKMVSMNLLMLLYFAIYTFMVIPMFITLKKLNMNLYKNFMLMNKNSFMNTLLVVIMLMSMAGLPPFTGFFLKLMVMYNMLEISLYFMMMLVIVSIMSLYFYLNMSYNSLLNI
uniref:NADH-ubiquinone oxidoreductase chain 2 n=1 Tax=Piscicola geometra TaxID=60958 RepID=A0A7D6W3Z6_9ANNE|nr:NADH dehydrogenase subunit 2 [Piscicola geometra]